MRRVWCFIVVCFVLLGVVQPAAAQSAGSENSGDGSDSDRSSVVVLADDPAVLSLVDELGISVEQAVGQMVSQIAAGDAEAALPKNLRKVFGGRSIRHDQGGVVEVGVTDPAKADRMKAHFIKFGVERVKILVLDHSQDEIDEMIDEKRTDLDRKLQKNSKAKNGKKRSVVVGQKELGKITIEHVPEELEPEEAEFVAEAKADPTLFTVEEVDELPEDAQTASCDWTGDIECDPPLRGSVFMVNPSAGETCSAGFNVRSRTDRKPYVLTAGHCPSGRWQTRFEDGSIHIVGSTHRRRHDKETMRGLSGLITRRVGDSGNPG